MKSTHTKFYIKVSEELKDECINAKMFRYINGQLICKLGYVWNTDKNQCTWSKRNYSKGTVPYCNISPTENCVFNNTVWFSMDNELYKDLKDDELQNIAVNAFIQKYNMEKEKLESKLYEINDAIRYFYTIL